MARAHRIRFLSGEHNVRPAVRRILMARLREMYSYEAGTLAGKDIERLHAMRVSARRVQAVLRVFEELFPARKYRRQYVRLRSVIRLLGSVRDLDVYIERLERHRRSLPERRRTGIDLAIAHARTDRAEERKLLTAALLRGRASNLRLRLNVFIAESFAETAQ